MKIPRATDPDGAVIFTDAVPTPTGQPYMGYDVFITPAGHRYRSKLGRVSYNENAILVERDANAPVHLNHGGYHLNRYLLTEGLPHFSRLAIVEPDAGYIYLPRIRDVLAEALPSKTNRTGLAAQVFITREWLQHYTVNVTEHLARLWAEVYAHRKP